MSKVTLEDLEIRYKNIRAKNPKLRSAPLAVVIIRKTPLRFSVKILAVLIIDYSLISGVAII